MPKRDPWEDLRGFKRSARTVGNADGSTEPSGGRPVQALPTAVFIVAHRGTNAVMRVFYDEAQARETVQGMMPEGHYGVRCVGIV